MTPGFPCISGKSVFLVAKAYFIRIPHRELAPATLRGVVTEFVTRDGTDHSSVDQRIESVLRQLEEGLVEVHFDPATVSCSIQPASEEDA